MLLLEELLELLLELLFELLDELLLELLLALLALDEPPEPQAVNNALAMTTSKREFFMRFPYVGELISQHGWRSSILDTAPWRNAVAILATGHSASK